jgi:hypothetical protein
MPHCGATMDENVSSLIEGMVEGQGWVSIWGSFPQMNPPRPPQRTSTPPMIGIFKGATHDDSSSQQNDENFLAWPLIHPSVDGSSFSPRAGKRHSGEYSPRPAPAGRGKARMRRVRGIWVTHHDNGNRTNGFSKELP